MSAGDEGDIFSVTIADLSVEIGIALTVPSSTEDLRKFVVSAISAANDVVGPLHGEVTILIDDDARIRDLNNRWRGQDKPTNVLSFPYPHAGPARYLGDIAISHETAAREASAERKPFAHHVAHLAVHGLLHLLGYDHVSDRAADKMEHLERVILGRIGIPDPYIAQRAPG